MNWYRLAYSSKLQKAMTLVHNALLCMKYTAPEVDLSTAGVAVIKDALEAAGCMDIPPSVDPERFAAMVGFLARNQDAESDLG